MELPAELVDLIARARPETDVRAAFLVAADWLQQRGDPWGELIGLAVGRTPATDRAAWRAELARIQRACDPYAPDAGHYRVRWSWGVVERLVFMARAPRASASELRDLLAAPVARLVRELVILDGGAGLSPLYQVVLGARLPNLRALQLVALDDTITTPDTDRLPLEPLVAHLPHLERLELDGRPTGTLAHAALQSLSLPRTRASDIAYAGLPQLATVRWPDHARVEELAADPQRLPALRELCVTVASGERAGMLEARVVESSLERQLYRLDLRVATARGAIADRRFPIDRARDHADPSAARAAGLIAFGSHGARVIHPVHSPFTVGSHHDATLSIHDDLHVAMHQATISRDEVQWILRDHGPELAARLGGQPIERAPLAAGDELWFGLSSYVFDDDIDLG